MIRISIAIAIVACWFGSMLFPTYAQTPAAPQAAVAIQDKPVLLGNVDYYKMEADAETQWKGVLPKLSKNVFDYGEAWKRLRTRRIEVVSQWWSRRMTAPEFSKERRELEEMYNWCGNVGLGDKSPSAERATEQFARLDVRVRLCEEKLPKAEKIQALQPNYDNRPMPFPGKPIEDKKSKR